MSTVYSRLGREIFSQIPRSPGVYFLIGRGRELLYVGKANDLRSRVSHYATANEISDARAADVASKITEIRWEVATDETEALLREAELIQALVPRFNRAHTQPLEYFFIQVSGLKAAQNLDFEVTASPGASRTSVYGCFPHLGKGRYTQPARWMKLGYLGLLRALYATGAGEEGLRFRKTIAGRSVPYSHQGPLPLEWHGRLHKLLTGQSSALLSDLSAHLESHARVPEFMKPALRRDVQNAAAFYASGPKRLKEFRRKHGLGSGPVEEGVMKDLLTAELHDLLGPFRTKR